MAKGKRGKGKKNRGKKGKAQASQSPAAAPASAQPVASAPAAASAPASIAEPPATAASEAGEPGPDRRRLGPGGWIGAGFAALVLLVAGWLAYAPTHSHAEFHFDDAHTISDNKAIRLLYNRTGGSARTDKSGAEQLSTVYRAHVDTAREIYDLNLYRMLGYWSFAYTYWSHPFAAAETAEERADAIAAWHVTNTWIHLINGLLAFWVAFLTLTAPALRKTWPTPWAPLAVAFLAAVLFTLHPLQTQAVTYLAQRFESLCATFYLLAMGLYATARLRSLEPGHPASAWQTPLAMGACGAVLFLAAVVANKTDLLDAGGFVTLLGLVFVAACGSVAALAKLGRDSWLHALATLGAFLAFPLALECKEIAATLPLAIVLWDLCFVPRQGWWERVRYLGPWAGVVFGVALLLAVFGGVNIARQLMAEGIEEGGGVTSSTLSGKSYLLTQANVYWTYFRLALLPVGQHLDYDYPIAGGGFDWKTISALLSALFLFACAGLAAWRGRKARTAAFALGFTCLVLAPTSTVIVLPDVIYEHRYYLPMFAVVLLLAVATERALRLALRDAQLRLAVVVALALLALVVLVPLTRSRNSVWKTDVDLWRDCAQKAPNKPRVWVNLGLALQEREPQQIRIKGKQGEATIAGTAVRFPTGEVLVISSRNLNEQPIPLPANAVVAITDTPGGGGPSAAIEAFERALEIEPDYYKAINNLATAYVAQGHVAAHARDQLRALGMLAKEQQKFAVARPLLERSLEQNKVLERSFGRAARAFIRITELRPDDHLGYSNLGTLFMDPRWSGRDTPRAVEYLRQATRMPDAPNLTFFQLGQALFQQGRRIYEAAERRGDAQPQAFAEARQPLEEAEQVLQRCLEKSLDSVYTAAARDMLRTVAEVREGRPNQ